jgi:hypothetical protein
MRVNAAVNIAGTMGFGDVVQCQPLQCVIIICPMFLCVDAIVDMAGMTEKGDVEQ